MLLNLNQLRVFYFAAREGGYRRAAEALFVTQPAVSQNIKALETYYGVGLFRKVGRSMELTPAGRTLYGFAERIFEAAEEADLAIREFARLERGEVRVGTTKIFARYLMPSIVNAFRERYPAVSVSLDEGSSEQMIRSVENLKNHIAVVGRMEYPARIRSQHFRRVELTLVAGAAHPFVGRGRVSWRDLEGQPLIVRETGAGSRWAVTTRLAEEGVTPHVVMESSSVDFIKSYVAEGRAVAFLFEPDMAEELSSGRLVRVPLVEGDLVLETDVVTPLDSYKSPAARAFLRVLEESSTAAWSVLPG
ncbi:MAG: LysR family transcriptional regulator [Thermoleophilia bacterium]